MTIRRNRWWPGVAATAVAAVVGWSAPAWAADRPLKVVATLSTFADLVKQVGGPDVEVSSVASPRFNPHFIEPRPSDVLRVKNADLLVHGGLDLEAWRGPLLDAAGNPKLFAGGEGALDLSQGIPLLEVPTQALNRMMGDIHVYGNPHYWTSPENGRVMASAIAAKLSALDPAHAAAYQQRLDTFLKRLDQKIAEWQRAASAIRGQEVIAYHNEWPYLAQFVGLKVEQFLEPKPGIPPSPKQLGFLEQYITAHGIKAIIQPTYQPRDSSDALAKRTGATVVILCQNVVECPEAGDYVAMVEYNIHQLVEALGAHHD